MTDWYRVVRTFPGPNGGRQPPGAVVDGTHWRNAPKLVAQGRLLPTSGPDESGDTKEANRAKPRHQG
ncbi:MAG: hypothetical protein ACTHMP_16935 [Thermomicrobiales bacterium]